MSRCILMLFCSAILTSGCISLAGETPRTDSYLLNVSRAHGAIEAQAEEAILQIRKFRVSPRYDDTKLVYRMDENTYLADYYNRFFVAPAVMVTEEVRKWMQSSRQFEQVLEGPSRVEPDYFLEGNVPALYGDFSQSPYLAVMEIEFTLLRELPAGPELLLQKSYRREIPLSEKSPVALINGFDEALTTILTKFEKDLREMDLTPVP